MLRLLKACGGRVRTFINLRVHNVRRVSRGFINVLRVSRGVHKCS